MSEDSELSDSDVDKYDIYDIEIQENILYENDDDQFSSKDDITQSEIAQRKKYKYNGNKLDNLVLNLL